MLGIPIRSQLTMCTGRLSTGVAVTVTGTWTPSQGQGQSYELQVSDVRVLGDNDAAVCGYNSCNTALHSLTMRILLIDLPHTEEISNCRVSADCSSLTTSTSIQCLDPATSVSGHCTNHQLFRQSGLRPMSPSNHHVV